MGSLVSDRSARALDGVGAKGSVIAYSPAVRVRVSVGVKNYGLGLGVVVGLATKP